MIKVLWAPTNELELALQMLTKGTCQSTHSLWKASHACHQPAFQHLVAYWVETTKYVTDNLPCYKTMARTFKRTESKVNLVNLVNLEWHNAYDSATNHNTWSR